MKNIFYIIFPLILFSSCNNDDEDSSISPLVGTWIGTVDLGGPVPFNTMAVIAEDGSLEWDIYLQNEEGQYIARYYWPSLSYQLISDELIDNWLYGKIEETETRIPFWSPPAAESGTYSSDLDGIEMSIGWNAHYAVFDFDATLNSYELRNVCVPQNFQLASDELCEGWESWELGTPFIGTRQ